MDAEKLKHRVSEIFFRDRIATSLGLQQLDLFLTRILNTLFHQSNMLPKDKLHLLLNYDSQRIMTGLDQINNSAVGIIYMGNKGLNLLKLKNLGLPVPPGFIVTTEAFRCRELIDGFAPVKKNFRQQVQAAHFPPSTDNRKTVWRPGQPPAFFSAKRCLHFPTRHDGNLSERGHQ